MNRGDLTYTFTKIALWRQIQFRKIVYLDADIVALRAPDELFDIKAPFAAAPDAGWPDAFNSGLMVISPDMGEYWALQTLAASGDSFDGADQGLLNQYYEHRNWHRISFTYNCTPNAEYQWEPAYRHYKSNISMVHFIGKDKPWTQGRQNRSGPGVYSQLLSRWWAVYDRHLKRPVWLAEFVHRCSANDLQSSALGGLQRPSAVHQHVKGESTAIDFGYSSIQHAVQPSVTLDQTPPPPQEQPFTDPGDVVEQIEQGVVEPTPTVEQRRLSAPQVQWDATR